VGVGAKADLRDGYTSGYKFNDWERERRQVVFFVITILLVPHNSDACIFIRASPFIWRSGQKQTLTVRRDNGAKAPVALADIDSTILKMLETVQSDLNPCSRRAQRDSKEVT